MTLWDFITLRWLRKQEDEPQVFENVAEVEYYPTGAVKRVVFKNQDGRVEFTTSNPRAARYVQR